MKDNYTTYCTLHYLCIDTWFLY